MSAVFVDEDSKSIDGSKDLPVFAVELALSRSKQGSRMRPRVAEPRAASAPIPESETIVKIENDEPECAARCAWRCELHRSRRGGRRPAATSHTCATVGHGPMGRDF